MLLGGGGEPLSITTMRETSTARDRCVPTGLTLLVASHFTQALLRQWQVSRLHLPGWRVVE